MQEQCYVFVHDKDKLAKFFEEDADLVARRLEATNKRDRLAKANAAMANIQVERGGLGLGPTRVRVTVALGQAGLGLQLADEGGRLVVRGFRAMEGPNPGMEAGIKAGDVIDQVSDGGGGSSYNRRSRGAEWCDVQLLNANGRATALPANGLFTAIGFDAQVKHALN